MTSFILRGGRDSEPLPKTRRRTRPTRFIEEFEEYNPFSNKFPDDGHDKDLQEFRELESSTMEESVPDSTYRFSDDGFSEEFSEEFSEDDSEEDFDSYACPECGEDVEDCVCSIKECPECGEDVEDCVCSIKECPECGEDDEDCVCSLS